MYIYYSNIFPQYQCGFRKGYSAQHCLLAMTAKMKEEIATVCAGVLTDISKAFDCFLHDRLIAKLHPFGFNFKSLRIQVTKVGSFCIEIPQIIYGVPQSSILRPVLFNVI